METWLAAPDGVGALLLDYVPLRAGAVAPRFAPGERFDAELVFYPSPAPLRAMIAEQGRTGAEPHGPPPGSALPAALAAHHARAALVPWIGDDLLLTTACRVAEVAGGFILTNSERKFALPLAARQAEAARPLLGMELSSAAAVWDGRTATLLAAQTSLGPWFDEP